MAAAEVCPLGYLHLLDYTKFKNLFKNFTNQNPLILFVSFETLKTQAGHNSVSNNCAKNSSIIVIQLCGS